MNCPHCAHPLSRADVARLLASANPHAAAQARRMNEARRVLTDAQRDQIRARKGSNSAAALAIEHGCSTSLIYAIWQGRR